MPLTPYILTAEDAHVLLSYNRLTGLLTWKSDRSRLAKAGDEAGYVGFHGVVMVGVRGRIYTASRVIWLMVTGEWPKGRLRFRDGNPENLRWNNLVEARTILSSRHNAVYQRRYRKMRAVAMRRIQADEATLAIYNSLGATDARGMLKRHMDAAADDMLRNDLDPADR